MATVAKRQKKNKRAIGLIALGGALLIGGLCAGKKKIVQLFSDIKLNDLNPAAKEKFTAFLNDVKTNLGWEPVITSGYRTQQRQAALMKTNAKAVSAGTSPHVYGLAIDANFRKYGLQLSSKSSVSAWEASGIPKLARQHGLRWGGDFSNADVVHFDYGWDPTIAQATFKKAVETYGNDWMKADLRTLV